MNNMEKLDELVKTAELAGRMEMAMEISQKILDLKDLEPESFKIQCLTYFSQLKP